MYWKIYAYRNLFACIMKFATEQIVIFLLENL